MEGNAKCCRICLEETEPEDMIKPCKCDGTSRWIHRQCASMCMGSVGMSCMSCKQEYVIETDATPRFLQFLLSYVYNTSKEHVVFCALSMFFIPTILTRMDRDLQWVPWWIQFWPWFWYLFVITIPVHTIATLYLLAISSNRKLSIAYDLVMNFVQLPALSVLGVLIGIYALPIGLNYIVAFVTRDGLVTVSKNFLRLKDFAKEEV